MNILLAFFFFFVSDLGEPRKWLDIFKWNLLVGTLYADWHMNDKALYNVFQYAVLLVFFSHN